MTIKTFGGIMTEKTSAILILILGFIFNHSIAQEKSIPIYKLQEIVVVGEKPIDPPHSFTEISRKEMEKSGVTNLAEALDLIASIDARTNSRGEVNFDVRGFGQRNIVIMLDGRPIYEPYFGTMDLSLIPVTNVERIKISNGPSSALYGPNAMGGVINIITKMVNKASASVNYGSGNHRNASIQIGKKFNSFMVGVVAGHNQADGFPVSNVYETSEYDVDGLRSNSDWRSSSLDGRISYQIKNQHTLSLSLGMINAQKGITPQLDVSRPRYWRFPEWQKNYIDLSGNFTLPAKMKLRTKAYIDRYENKLVNYKSQLYQSSTWESLYRNYVLGGHAYLDKKFSNNHYLTTGFLLKEDHAKILSDLNEPWESYKAQTFSIVVQDEFKIKSKWSFMFGSSYDILNSYDDKNTTSLNPQVGLVYKLFKRSSFHLLLGKKTRFPTLKENSQANLENIHLKPEKANSFDLGLRQSFNNFIFSSTFFYSKVEDLINRKNRFFPFENIDQARMQGFENELTFQLNPSHIFQMRYVYLDAKDLTKNTVLDYRAKHKLVFNSDHKLPYSLFFNLNVMYLGKRYYRGSDILPEYFTVDIRISKNIMHSLRLSLTARNLTDKYYEDEIGFPMPGRTVQVGLHLSGE